MSENLELTFRALLKDLDRTLDERFLETLPGLFSAAQTHRHELKNSTETALTRSTALVALAQFDEGIGAALEEVFDWPAYKEHLALGSPITSNEDHDVAVHQDFAEALSIYSERHPETRVLSPRLLALAILEMAARGNDGGRVAARLTKHGAELRGLPGRFIAAFESQPTIGPRVWLYQCSSEFVEENLATVEPEEPVEFRIPALIEGIAPGNHIIFWHTSDGNESEGIIGTGRFATDPPNQARNGTTYTTSIKQLFLDAPLPRPQVVAETNLDVFWGEEPILAVDSAHAEKIHRLLLANERAGLFDDDQAVASEVVLIGDAPKSDVDFLDRSDLAFVLAARLNRVWQEMNPPHTPEESDGIFSKCRRWFRGYMTGVADSPDSAPFQDSFVTHIDAQWGGGKTSFANYLTRILNPGPSTNSWPDWLVQLPMRDSRMWPQEFRQPWHVVKFNAWNHQHVDPPWWCLYEAVRSQCFEGVRTGSSGLNPPLPPKQPGESESARNVEAWFARHRHWVNFWGWELLWRLFNPKVTFLLLTFIGTWIVALSLQGYGLFDPTVLKKPFSGGLADSELSTLIATALVVILGGASAIGSVVSTLTQSLMPGTPSAAKNYSLGSGDPLKRFRKHFDRMMRRLKWPVVVVIDDIDRCNPEFVVELMRGLQTIFRSPRVIFVLLGDRDWIEHAFAHVHKAMAGIEVGPEHTFGGRFVEKVIQLSFVLPDVPEERRSRYVQQLLGLKLADDDSKALTSLQTKLHDANEEVVAARETFNEYVEDVLNESDPFKRDRAGSRLRDQIEADSVLKSQPEALGSFLSDIDRRMALRASSDGLSQQATQHRLSPIATALPPNPRQVKRIINTIALFGEIARIEEGIQPDSRAWSQLALWVTLMTEWPRTWATLTRYPELADRILGLEVEPEDSRLSEALATAWAEEIKRTPAVMQLLEFGKHASNRDWMDVVVDGEAIKQFRQFMPAVGASLMPAPEAEESKANV